MNIDSGASAWRQVSNHNRMIELQSRATVPGPVKLAYFCSSAFRIIAPSGLTLMIDPSLGS